MLGDGMSKEAFKSFVRENPRLIRYVKNNEMTWQKFYEMYDMYGTDSEVWDEYLKDEQVTKNNNQNNNFNDVVNYFKNINLDSVQESINSIQRVLGVVGDLTAANTSSDKKTYEPKPIYKHFDD